MIKRKEKIAFESPERLNRIVEGTKIKGDLNADSSIRIDGEVEGNVFCASKIVVGPSGLIKGHLNCSEADIEGKITGNLSIGNLLILRENAQIIGDIKTSKLHIEEGAEFNGRCQMNLQNVQSTVETQFNDESSIIY